MCTPNEKGGNYIMYTFSTSGREPNNYLFSECSKAQIWPIIFTKGPRCFIGKTSNTKLIREDLLDLFYDFILLHFSMLAGFFIIYRDL